MENDEAYYERVTEELEAGHIRRGLWTKALVTSDGDEKAAKIAYIRFRVEQLKEESRQRQVAAAEDLRRIQAKVAEEARQRRATKARSKLKTFLYGETIPDTEVVRRKSSGSKQELYVWLVIVVVVMFAACFIMMAFVSE